MNAPNQPPKSKTGWLPWAGGLLVIAVLLALWRPLAGLVPDASVLRIWIEQLGPLAPVAFFVLNMIQIVVAPIPGYPVQVLGGVLFGFVPGVVVTVGGMVAGGVLAAWLGRRLGRPWLEKRVGADTLANWSRVAHIDSFWTWWLVFLIPLGDIPYFIAGLSRLRLSTVALAILTSRGPFTVLIVWMGDSVVDLPLTWLALMLAGVGLIVIVGFSQAARIEAWTHAFLHRRLAANPPDPADGPDQS